MKKLLIFIIFGVNGGKRKKGDKGGEKCYKNCLCDTKLIDCHGQGFGEFLVNTDESDITTVTKLDLRSVSELLRPNPLLMYSANVKNSENADR